MGKEPHIDNEATDPLDGRSCGERSSSLGELIADYCAALQREKPASEETQQRFREYLDTIFLLLGDHDINEYTHKDLLTLKSRLLRWPVNAGKAPEYRDKTVAEILRMKVTKPLDKRVVDSKYMAKIMAVFQYAFRTGRINGDITQSLTTSLTVAEQRGARRKMYSSADLSKIFALLPCHPDRPYVAWLPLVAAYSGALPGELCRLRIRDIISDCPIPHMVLTGEDAGGQVCKNLRGEVSRRLAPLHPVLLELGFLAFVAQRKAAGRDLLFEKRSRLGDGYEAVSCDAYSHSFETFNRKFITNDLRKGFDSFGRNLRYELQQKNISPEMCHGITGSVPQFDDISAPGAAQLLADKYRALVQLHYPGLDLQLLKEKFRVFTEGGPLGHATEGALPPDAEDETGCAP